MTLPLALLLTTLAAAPAAAGDAEAPAVSVDVTFRCKARVTRSLTLLPGTQAQLEVPADCPDAGRPWRLMLQCREGRCMGAVLAEGGSIARIHGSRLELFVSPLAQEHPATLKLMALRVTAQQRAQVDAAALVQRPLELRFQAATFASSYRVDAAAATEVQSPRLGSRAVLVVQAVRQGLQHAQLLVWNAEKELLLQRTVRLEEPLAFDCAKSGGWCTGRTELTVREARPR